MPTGSVSRLLSIVLIDLVLAGDNALVIAMAVRALPRPQQRIASICGALAAVTLRIALTIVATRLLDVEFLKLAGGALVIWIAVKVLADAHSAPEKVPAHGRLIGAIGLIVFADITMSVDNILAVADRPFRSTNAESGADVRMDCGGFDNRVHPARRKILREAPRQTRCHVRSPTSRRERKFNEVYSQVSGRVAVFPDP